MSNIGFLRVALEAELIRLRVLLKRQALRGVYAVVAVIFALSVLVLLDVLVWQAIRLSLMPIPTTVVVLGINIVLCGIFAALAARSSPSHAEQEALRLRQDALKGARNSLLVTGAVVAGRSYLNKRRRRAR